MRPLLSFFINKKVPVTSIQNVEGFFLNDLPPSRWEDLLKGSSLDLLFYINYMHLMSELNLCSVIKSEMLHWKAIWVDVIQCGAKMRDVLVQHKSLQAQTWGGDLGTHVEDSRETKGEGDLESTGWMCKNSWAVSQPRHLSSLMANGILSQKWNRDNQVFSNDSSPWSICSFPSV